MWEQNDVGVGAGHGARQPGQDERPAVPAVRHRARCVDLRPKQYNSPGENHVTTDPTRSFPDLAQILINNTNAVDRDCPGACAAEPPSAERRPAAADRLLLGVPADGARYPRRPLHFRLTARDGHPAGGGIESSDTTLTLAPGTGPFLVTSQGAGDTVNGHAPVTVTWNVAGTDLPPISART